MSNFAAFFQNLQLHRVPFLTTEILALIIPSMRNIRVLGVYKCQLIHVGHSLRLLEIITTDKPKGKKSQVSLDFYPNYHVGPFPFPGNEYHTGDYGVTWDNWNGDSRIGIWALLVSIIPAARSQNVDFESPHTMFRQWLDRSPCWHVARTLEVMMDKNQTDLDFVVMVDYPNTDGSHRRFTGEIRNRPEGWKWYVCSPLSR